MSGARLWRFGRVGIPVGTLIFLAVFSIQFAAERLYSDSGYYLARVINEGMFRIEHGRYVLALSQVVPLIGSKLGIPMGALILLHSLNNVVFLALCMWFTARVLKNDMAVIALAAVHLIGLTHGLFCPIFEMYYGVGLLILFHATLRTEQLRSPWRWSLLLIFFLGAVSSHFLTALLAIGMLVQERVWRDRRITFVLATMFIAQISLRLLTLSMYERKGLEFLRFLFDPAKLFELVQPARLGELAHYVLWHYADAVLIAIATITILVRSRLYRQLFVLVTGLLVLHILASLFLPDFLPDRYHEQIHFVHVAWVLLNLCFLLLPEPPFRTVILGLLTAALIFRMVRAEWIAPYYAARTAWIENRIAEAHARGMDKAIVPWPVQFGLPNHAIDLSWSTSVESLLLSAREGPEATVSLITAQDTLTPEVASQLDRFIFRRWEILDPNWLDPRYFTAPQGSYVPLPQK